MNKELFNKNQLLSLLAPVVQKKLSQLEILPEVNSTNQYLLNKAKAGADSGFVCLAEKQTAGRGRQGKKWVSLANANIACSILWHFPVAVTQLSGLSLALGVAVIRTLHIYGISQGVGVKWPNDIYVDNKKLAGILVEVAEHKADACKIVIGVGVNLDLSLISGTIDQAWTDIKTITGQTPNRNELTAILLNEFFTVLCNFARQGFREYRKEWINYDVMLGKRVNLLVNSQSIIKGIAHNINDQGELVIKNEAGIVKTFSSGEISLRLD